VTTSKNITATIVHLHLQHDGLVTPCRPALQTKTPRQRTPRPRLIWLRTRPQKTCSWNNIMEDGISGLPNTSCYGSVLRLGLHVSYYVHVSLWNNTCNGCSEKSSSLVLISIKPLKPIGLTIS